MSEKYLKQKQACEKSGYSAFWHERKRRTGGGPPFVKMENGQIRYPESLYDAWFTERLARSTSDPNYRGTPRKPYKRKVLEDGTIGATA